VHKSYLFFSILLVAGSLVTSVAVVGASTIHAKSTYSIMSITPQPSDGLDQSLGQQAWVDQINADGGIDGHHINLIKCFTGTFTVETEDQSFTCAQEAVSDHVLAVVGSTANYDGVMFPILAAARIPDVGNFPSSAADYTSPESFPLIGNEAALSGGIAVELVQVGHCKKVAMIDEAGTATTSMIDTTFALGAKWAKAKVAPAIDLTATVSDLTPTVAILEGENVDCVADFLTGTLAALLTAIKDSGVPMKAGFVDAVVPASELVAIGPDADGVYADQWAQDRGIVSNSQLAGSTSEERLMIADWHSYAPAALGMSALCWPTFAAAVAFGQILKTVIADKLAVTGSNMLKVMKTITINTGLFPPVDFGTPAPVKAWPRIHVNAANFITVRDDAYVAVDRKTHSMNQPLANYK
jgi:ABC-type branched-subunit amino acid transport system substrate-binding protein